MPIRRSQKLPEHPISLHYEHLVSYFELLITFLSMDMIYLFLKPCQAFCVIYLITLDYYLNVEKYTTTIKRLCDLHNIPFWPFDVA
jgi:hypothetical protein